MKTSQGITTSREGVVTFLDILGWKGIYQRNDDPLSTLQVFIKRLGERLSYWQEASSLRNPTTVRTISDTIALFAHASPHEAQPIMDLHGKVCADMIPLSIQWGIPVRGALCFGEFDERDNMFVGKAVDEAASWYEAADWIGVHMTPSAALLYPTTLSAETSNDVWRLYAPPFSKGGAWETRCVNWPGLADQEESYIGYSYADMKTDFRQMGPIGPEIVGKYTNTLRFWDKMMDSQNGLSNANRKIHAALNRKRSTGRP